ncbi:tyrosine-type recombinase/integrase [Sphingomonas bacterium]|uniref:tyrosine-type recombinase/integrase n=1 Tax=Sphingomonas bacterium TaxID=1895847 RepID=UPI001575922B|nr:site-specific integrase [Sphingomonas bacterium]
MPVIKITNTAILIATCPPDKRKITLFDEALTGFMCEIAHNRKTYAVRYTDDRSKQIQYKIGDASVLTADQARRVALRVKAQALTGESPQAKRKVIRQVPTLAEFAPRYLDHARENKRSSDIDERYLRLHLLPRFGKQHLDKLNQTEIMEWLNGKVKDGYAQATVNRWQVILSCMMRLAGDWGVPGAERNPLKGAKLKDPDNRKERFLTQEEVRRLKVAVEQSPNAKLGQIVALLLLTGCRKREILDAKWDQVDFENKSLKILKGKTGARHVPLGDEALAVFRSIPRLDRCPYIVANPKTKVPFTSIFTSWDQARHRAGLGDVRLHDLRHTLASHLAQSGHSLWVIANVLGHAQTRTTERYAHLSTETLRNAVNTAVKASGTTWTLPTI